METGYAVSLDFEVIDGDRNVAYWVECEAWACGDGRYEVVSPPAINVTSMSVRVPVEHHRCCRPEHKFDWVKVPLDGVKLDVAAIAADLADDIIERFHEESQVYSPKVLA